MIWWGWRKSNQGALIWFGASGSQAFWNPLAAAAGLRSAAQQVREPDAREHGEHHP